LTDATGIVVFFYNTGHRCQSNKLSHKGCLCSALLSCEQ